MKEKDILTPEHPKWDEFMSGLEGRRYDGRTLKGFAAGVVFVIVKWR